MKAIGYIESQPIDAADALIDFETQVPVAQGHDLLIEVLAVSVNPVDTKIRQRVSPQDQQPKVLGWDAVGIVRAIGDKVTLFKEGERVWYAGDLTRAGSNAEFQLVDERIVGKAPTNWSDEQAAAMPLTVITAWELLFDRLQVSRDAAGKDVRLLITGAAGGVGSVMVQLARQLTGATVIATASRPESQRWVTELGAHYVLDHSQPLAPQLEANGLDDVTHVASLTHTEQHFSALVEMLKPQGRLALIDDPAEPLDIMSMKMKSLSLHWEFMYTRSMFNTDDMIEQHLLLNEVAALADLGRLQSTLGESFGAICAENLKRAHQQLESGTTIGKVVLSGFNG